MPLSKIPLEELSLQDLTELQAKLTESLDQKKRSQLEEARRKLDLIIEEYGFTVDEIIDIKSKKTKTGALSAAKYRNPEDFSQTWSGKGRRPDWIVKFLESGNSLDEILI